MLIRTDPKTPLPLLALVVTHPSNTVLQLLVAKCPSYSSTLAPIWPYAYELPSSTSEFKR